MQLSKIIAKDSSSVFWRSSFIKSKKSSDLNDFYYDLKPINPLCEDIAATTAKQDS